MYIFHIEQLNTILCPILISFITKKKVLDDDKMNQQSPTRHIQQIYHAISSDEQNYIDRAISIVLHTLSPTIYTNNAFLSAHYHALGGFLYISDDGSVGLW